MTSTEISVSEHQKTGHLGLRCTPSAYRYTQRLSNRQVWPSAARSSNPVRGKTSRSQAEPSPSGRETRICAKSLPAKNCTRKEVLHFPAVGQSTLHLPIHSRMKRTLEPTTHCTEIFASEKGRPVEVFTTSSLVPMELMCTDGLVYTV